jgi:hypothetical protein
LFGGTPGFPVFVDWLPGIQWHLIRQKSQIPDTIASHGRRQPSGEHFTGVLTAELFS